VVVNRLKILQIILQNAIDRFKKYKDYAKIKLLKNKIKRTKNV
jgi:hypothetical protein